VKLIIAEIAEIEKQDHRKESLHGRQERGKTRDQDAQLLNAAYSAIANIRRKTTEYGGHQETLLQPFVTLSKFIATVFADKGIAVAGGLELGEGQKKISSDLLSAGEKQIFSFLVYNAFYDSIPIFIDEPEISLHVDWQRTLFPTLLQQKTGNQFIIATHSPFIYSKYSDKEITLRQPNDD
jgi:ABC-type lipoprotein export system ATPase subunit